MVIVRITIVLLIVCFCACDKQKSTGLETNTRVYEKNIFSELFNNPLDSIFENYYFSITQQIPRNIQNKRIYVVDFFYKDSLVFCEISSAWAIPALCLESDYSIICTAKINFNQVVFISNINDTIGFEYLKHENWLMEKVYHEPRFEYLANKISIKNRTLFFEIKNGTFQLSKYERYIEQNDDYFNSIPTPCEINFPPDAK